MFKIEILPFLRCAVDCLLNECSVVRMSFLQYELHCWLIGSVAFKNTESLLRPVEFPAGNIPTETARMAQPLRLRQIGFAALQLGGPFCHLRLEFVPGFTKLLLALAYRFLGAAVILDEACRPKCCCGMIRGHGEQQLVNFGRKVGVITCCCNHTPLGIDPDGNDNTAASLCAIADVANNFRARQSAVDGEVILQPFGKCLPSASSRDFDGGTSVGIAQT